MMPHSVIRFCAGALGVVVGLVFGVVAVAGLLVALGLPADSRADDPLLPPSRRSRVRPSSSSRSALEIPCCRRASSVTGR